MLRLQPLPDYLFAAYIDRSVEQYTADLMQSRGCAEPVARHQAEKSILHLLPNGNATEGHHINGIWTEIEPDPIGVLWYEIEESTLFIYDFEVYLDYRRLGYGAEVLKLVEAEAIRLGMSHLELNVFGHNVGARALYEGTGFEAIEITMHKRIAQAAY
ncbi:GNAT family N-acetyltransferase [Glaciimonas sp. Gout2]|uniref:GNAT family N-acetyltransferase n=1 Tax=unclassified Glaciimonas TaxID=2644401 RepID=UPI002B22CFED|nr:MULTISPECIES: GNAT family N-acetyltransferase [unclassified Glaciimonas]MEB0013675.1 GNAT family N-acetyltransferase [Glaciimonas sp. Cout2]MEB0084588.1 GNAT family N-acetyltransferase [Glaciimonas sp. Gout2]